MWLLKWVMCSWVRLLLISNVLVLRLVLNCRLCECLWCRNGLVLMLLVLLMFFSGIFLKNIFWMCGGCEVWEILVNSCSELVVCYEIVRLGLSVCWVWCMLMLLLLIFVYWLGIFEYIGMWSWML